MTDTSYKTTFNQLSDMQDYIGKEIGLSEWLTIDQETINGFAKLTKDEQWIHVDVEKSAIHSPYKTTIAHGFLVLSLASHFSYECLAFKDVGMGVNYGLDKVRFTNATPVGAKIRGRISLMEYETKEGGAKYKLKLVMELDGQEKPACIAEWIGLAYNS